MNQKQQQGIAAQEMDREVVIVDGYNIQQSIVDEKDRDSKKPTPIGIDFLLK
ncbi:hypothetical protein P7H15_26105 [Paenibacillus larvae]|nr:hypothetical protein [Paenibacillus larvae]MDT2295596.1 hypothetical protein [Paenibacillus larvae]